MAFGSVPKVQKKGCNKNAAEEGWGACSPADRHSSMWACECTQGSGGSFADRGLVWYQDHPAQKAMQRMVTLRPSGPASPAWEKEEGFKQTNGAGGQGPLLPSD